MRIIKLHIYVFSVIVSRLKKQAKIREHIIFFRNLGKSYLKELLNTYRYYLNFFDPEYRKQRHNFQAIEKMKKDLYNAWKIIQWMIKSGKDKNERKFIRRDFTEHGRITKETELAILKDLYGYRE